MFVCSVLKFVCVFLFVFIFFIKSLSLVTVFHIGMLLHETLINAQTLMHTIACTISLCWTGAPDDILLNNSNSIEQTSNINKPCTRIFIRVCCLFGGCYSSVWDSRANFIHLLAKFTFGARQQQRRRRRWSRRGKVIIKCMGTS